MITVTFPFWVWIACIISILIGSKEMQQGGIKWARSEPWQVRTLIASLLLLWPLIFILGSVIVAAIVAATETGV